MINTWIETPDSSNVAKYAHADSTLSVVFKHGGTYAYDNVPVSVFEQMKVAESVGSFLAKNIKGTYPYRKV